MSLLGKILAILNVLAAAVFCYMAIMDYGKRQAWSYAVYRHQLALRGLPLTDTETDREGNRLFQDLDDDTRQDLFRQASPPVRTQAEAVQGVQQDLQGKIDGANPITIANPLDLKAKLELTNQLQKLAWVNRPLAELAGRREALNQLMNAGDGDELDDVENYGEIFIKGDGGFDPAFEAELKKLDEALRRDAIVAQLKKMNRDARREAATRQLQADLSRALADAIPRGPEQEPKRDAEANRRAVARVLFSRAELEADEKTAPGQPRIVANTQDYRRAVVVTGLEMAVRELDHRAGLLVGMAEATFVAMMRDGSLFVQQHQALLTELLAAADDLFERRNDLEREKAKVAAQMEVLNGRLAEVKKLDDELGRRRKGTAGLLTEQSDIERRLFKLQQDFRDAAAQNEQLERDIGRLEKGR